jgi:hypothetical protein
METLLEDNVNKAFSSYVQLSKKRDDADNVDFNNRMMFWLDNLVSQLNCAMSGHVLRVVAKDAKGNRKDILPDQILSYYDYRNIVYGKEENGKMVLNSFNLNHVMWFEVEAKPTSAPASVEPVKISVVDALVDETIRKNSRELLLAFYAKKEKERQVKRQEELRSLEHMVEVAEDWPLQRAQQQQGDGNGLGLELGPQHPYPYPAPPRPEGFTVDAIRGANERLAQWRGANDVVSAAAGDEVNVLVENGEVVHIEYAGAILPPPIQRPARGRGRQTGYGIDVQAYNALWVDAHGARPHIPELELEPDFETEIVPEPEPVTRPYQVLELVRPAEPMPMQMGEVVAGLNPEQEHLVAELEEANRNLIHYNQLAVQAEYIQPAYNGYDYDPDPYPFAPQPLINIAEAEAEADNYARYTKMREKSSPSKKKIEKPTKVDEYCVSKMVYDIVAQLKPKPKPKPKSKSKKGSEKWNPIVERNIQKTMERLFEQF